MEERIAALEEKHGQVAVVLSGALEMAAQNAECRIMLGHAIKQRDMLRVILAEYVDSYDCPDHGSCNCQHCRAKRALAAIKQGKAEL